MEMDITKDNSQLLAKEVFLISKANSEFQRIYDIIIDLIFIEAKKGEFYLDYHNYGANYGLKKCVVDELIKNGFRVVTIDKLNSSYGPVHFHIGNDYLTNKYFSIRIDWTEV